MSEELQIMATCGSLGQPTAGTYPAIIFQISYNALQFSFLTTNENYSWSKLACACMTRRPYGLYCETNIGTVLFDVSNDYGFRIRIGNLTDIQVDNPAININGNAEKLAHAFATAWNIQDEWKRAYDCVQA